MIFRLSQKLNTKIKAGALSALPLDENPYSDWSARLFRADRAQYILLSNTVSLYSTVLHGRGITHDNTFIDRAMDGIREFMEDDGQTFVYQRFIAPASGRIRFAKALNRTVTGIMNDMVENAIIWLTEHELAPHEVGFRLNRIPYSSLEAPRGAWRTPREAFKELLVRSGGPDA